MQWREIKPGETLRPGQRIKLWGRERQGSIITVESPHVGVQFDGGGGGYYTAGELLVEIESEAGRGDG